VLAGHNENFKSLHSSEGIMAGWPVFESRLRVVQTESGVHPASYPLDSRA
jgi:hypothetical protein